jgi:hypothetical protein
LPFVDPAALDLKALFSDKHMFVSRRSWSAMGFQVLDRADNGKIMVAAHPSAPGLLFKKYCDDKSLKDQRANYKRRVEGADRLRSFVDKQFLRHVAVPRKQLLELPRPFSRRAYILVVERLDLLNDEQTRAVYHDLDPDILRELSVVLFHFRGMDSNAKNVPLIADGRVAFIDTEHWDRDNNKIYLHQLRAHLSIDRCELSKTIFDQLEKSRGILFKETAAVSKRFDGEDTSSVSSS